MHENILTALTLLPAFSCHFSALASNAKIASLTFKRFLHQKPTFEPSCGHSPIIKLAENNFKSRVDMKCWRKWEKFHLCLFSNPKTNQNCCFLLREISRIFKILHAFDQHSRQSLEMLLIYSRVVSSAQLQLSHCCSGFFSRQFNAAASNYHYRNELKTFNSDKALALNWITSHDKTVSFWPMTSEWFFCLCFCWSY